MELSQTFSQCQWGYLKVGPTLFTLFTNDLSPCVRSGSLYMFTDDTTVFCIGDMADEAIVKLNRALQEVYDWCGGNQLTPYPGKSEAMLLCRRNPMGPIAPVFLGDSCIKWVAIKSMRVRFNSRSQVNMECTFNGC